MILDSLGNHALHQIKCDHIQRFFRDAEPFVLHRDLAANDRCESTKRCKNRAKTGGIFK